MHAQARTLLPSAMFRSALAAAALAVCGATQAAAVYYTIDLRGGANPAFVSPFISFVAGPADSNGDGWYETVMKINLRDPALANPYQYAQFRVSYDGAPTGLTVNIGDSASNNGGSGDGGTQSNDAELQVGGLLGSTAAYDDLRVFGKDGTPPAEQTQVAVDDVATLAHDLYLTAGNEYVAWDNGQGVAGERSSPYLYALDGQADTEGAVNYDIYAAFNRVIQSDARIGAGVGQVTVCLSTDASCFAPVSLPGSLSLAALGLGALGLSRSRQPPGCRA